MGHGDVELHDELPITVERETRAAELYLLKAPVDEFAGLAETGHGAGSAQRYDCQPLPLPVLDQRGDTVLSGGNIAGLAGQDIVGRMSK